MTLPLASHTQDNCPARQCLYRGPNSCRAFGPFDWSPPVATDIPRLTFRALKKEICIFGRGQSLLHSHSEAKQTRTQHQQVIKEILEDWGCPRFQCTKHPKNHFRSPIVLRTLASCSWWNNQLGPQASVLQRWTTGLVAKLYVWCISLCLCSPTFSNPVHF